MVKARRRIGLGHADDGSGLVAEGVVGGLGGVGHENDGDVAEAIVIFDDGAEIVAGDVAAFDLGENDVRDIAVEKFESFASSGNDHDLVAIP